MKLKIIGLVYATHDEIEKSIIINMSEDVDFKIEHRGEFSIITLPDEEWYLDTSSIEYELIG